MPNNLAASPAIYPHHNIFMNYQPNNMPHVFEVADRLRIARPGKRAAVANPETPGMRNAVTAMTHALSAERSLAECLAH